MKEASWTRDSNRVVITYNYEVYSFTLGCSRVKWENTESGVTNHFNYFIGEGVIRIRTGPSQDYTSVCSLKSDHSVYKAFMDAITEKELLDTIYTDSNYY